MFPAVPLPGLIRSLNCKLTSCPDLEDERNAPGVTIEVVMVHVNSERKFGTGTPIRLLLCLCQVSLTILMLI